MNHHGNNEIIKHHDNQKQGLQVQYAAWQSEIPGKSNNNTETLNKRKTARAFLQTLKQPNVLYYQLTSKM